MADIAPNPTAPPKPTTPTPAPSPNPAPVAPPAKVEDHSDNPFDAHEAKLRAAAKAKETPKDAKVEPAKDPVKEPVKAEVPKDERKIGEGPKALREQLEKVSGELKTKTDAIAAMEKRIADADAKGKDTTVLTERLATLEKQLEERTSELRAAKQEVTPEFVEKYDKPLNTAYTRAVNTFKQLEVSETDGAGEKRTRAATEDDLKALFHMPYNKMIPMVKAAFGDSSEVVVRQIEKLHELAENRKTAYDEEKAQWGEREKMRVAERSKHEEFVNKTWAQVNKDIAEKHPEWYQPDPEDAEDSKLLQEGYALVDAEPATMEKKIVHDANVRNRAAAFSRMVYRVQKRDARIAELEAQVAEMKASDPGDVHRKGGDAPSQPKGMMDDLRETMAKA